MPVGPAGRATVQVLRDRARIIESLRSFFRERSFLEVETPVLSPWGSAELHIEHFTVALRDAVGYLQSSPEWYMKRLLAHGCGAIFQICKCFRADEQSALHNPEFTMLEWYRAPGTLQEIIDDAIALVQFLVPGVASRLTGYRELFQSNYGLDLDRAAHQDLCQLAADCGLAEAGRQDKTTLLDFFLDDMVRRADRRLLWVINGFPPEQASYAQLDAGPPVQAQRFEMFYHGMELANGYQELRDTAVCRARNDTINGLRQAQDKPAYPFDPKALAALGEIPPCAGVALGVDRLVQAVMGLGTIQEVLSFPVDEL